MSTTIKIGHATISEDGTAYGAAGDQAGGNEVCTVDNYNIVTRLSPNVLLRPKTSALAEASAAACELGCANDHIGYSQSGRNTLYSYAKNVNFDLSKVTTNCNTDCSAFMTVCAISGGSKISYGSNAPTTSNMRTRFKQSGDYTVLTDSKHLTQTDYLKRGDILVKEGKHTVMVLENGSQYKDEVYDPEDPGASTGITPTRTIHTYLLDVDISNIKTTSATIKFTVIKCTNGIEKILTNISKWTFQLNIKTLPDLKVSERKFSSNELDLTGLTAGHSYLLQVNAIKDDKIAFCSTSKIFTTEQKKDSADEPHIEFGDINIKPFELIDKVYIKDKDVFKQAVIYKNI